MALVAAAAPAMVFGARDRELVVDGGIESALDRGIEARPAGSALVLGVGSEQRRATAGADEQAAALLVVQLAAAGPLGGFFPQDPIAVGRQQLRPFLRAALDAFVRIPEHLARGKEFARIRLLSCLAAHDCLAAVTATAMVTPPRASSRAVAGFRHGGRSLSM